ncbi:hypothetical protein AURDEDRAFT_129392 [Auricularia subglabra TFB-10046 SS5]|uniref:Uncharacterized protein n=1 Tax=Auricularia subglabra (strain TFB-10046 / SS5) TaxID=717982 RepID=J0DAN7_AURST|nr:hypothetical protein AURDEDRAFT_129392 [Auricularia subglabra TFB-10046 SS5]
MSLVNATVVKLPSGVHYVTSGHYTPGDSAGVVALVIAAGMSCISVVTLLILLIISATRSVQAPGQVVFIRTHVAAYFVSLLFCDFWQSIGSLLSIRWVHDQGVSIGVSCTAQAAIKNGGNVGTAIWSLVIALHTFFVLFVGRRPWEPALYITLILVWPLIGFIVVLGPGIIEDTARGPYFGISGIWCWITDGYNLQKLMLEYLWMFASAFISLILYALILLKLRGNLVVSGKRWKLRRAPVLGRWDPQTGQGTLEGQVTGITRQMMLFPTAYIIVILPIAACRYASWAGNNVPFQVLIFAFVVQLYTLDTVLISQQRCFINAVLFICTRNVIPADHRNIFRVDRDDDEKDADPETVHLRGAGKPMRVKQINAIITIEPARTFKEKLRPSPRLVQMNRPAQPAPRLSREELGKINANYAPVPPPKPAPSRPRTPFRIVNATETSFSMDSRWAGVSLLEHPATPPTGSHQRSSSVASDTSYLSDDSTTPLTASARRESVRMSRSAITPPLPRATSPSPLLVNGTTAPALVVSGASPVPATPPRAHTPTALSLSAAARRPPPTSVPNTARPPTPASDMTSMRRSHSSAGSHDRASGEAQYVSVQHAKTYF